MANPMPAIKALNKKSSNIVQINACDQRFHLANVYDHVHADK